MRALCDILRFHRGVRNGEKVERNAARKNEITGGTERARRRGGGRPELHTCVHTRFARHVENAAMRCLPPARPRRPGNNARLR